MGAGEKKRKRGNKQQTKTLTLLNVELGMEGSPWKNPAVASMEG